MMKHSFKALVLCSFATALLSLPPQSLAQATGSQSPQPVAKAETSSSKKRSGGPFRGKVAAVDKATKTVKVGKRTFQITPETKIRKGDAVATLEAVAVGEKCSGYVKPTEDGKWIATSLNLGEKTKTSGEKKKKKKNAEPKPEAE